MGLIYEEYLAIIFSYEIIIARLHYSVIIGSSPNWHNININWKTSSQKHRKKLTGLFFFV
jgi:hypothetical protein